MAAAASAAPLVTLKSAEAAPAPCAAAAKGFSNPNDALPVPAPAAAASSPLPSPKAAPAWPAPAASACIAFRSASAAVAVPAPVAAAARVTLPPPAAGSNSIHEIWTKFCASSKSRSNQPAPCWPLSNQPSAVRVGSK